MAGDAAVTEPVRRHPNSHDLYTPMTDDLLATLTRMRDEHGSWRRVAAVTETRLKVLRNIRSGRKKAISQRLWDRLTTLSGVGSIEEVPWFTADDLVVLGIWKPVRYVEGSLRIQDGVVTEHPNHGHKNMETREREKIAKMKRKMGLLPAKNPFGLVKPKWLHKSGVIPVPKNKDTL